jgi:Family of unknown function (DUF6152)
MNLKAATLAAFGIAAFTMPALAHHSFAMFDAEKTITVQGTVKELALTNPHSWLRVMIQDDTTGQLGLWALEMSSPARLKRMGLSADSLQPGDTVSVTFHPLKDGARGGQFLRAVLPNGKHVIWGNEND